MPTFDADPTPVNTLTLATNGVSTLLAVNGSGAPVRVTSPIKSDGHSFSWGDLGGGSVWDGVSDYQASFGQIQTTFLTNGSLGAGYFQRLCRWTGGADSDGVTPVCAPVRGYNQIASTVTYCNEVGGLVVTDNYSWLGQAVGLFGQARSHHGGRTFGLEAEAVEYRETFSSANGNLTAGQTEFYIPNGYTAGQSVVVKNGTLLTDGVDYTETRQPGSDQTGTVTSISSANGTTCVVNFSGGWTPTVGSWLELYGQIPSAYSGRRKVVSSGAGTATIECPATVAVTTLGSVRQNSDTAGSITLGTPVISSDVIEVGRGDPQFATLGGEVIIYPNGGTDNHNPISGNRVVLSLSAWRNNSEARDTRAGTILSLNTKPGDSYLTADRGILFQGRFKYGIDFTSSNVTFTDYLMKFNASSGAGIDANMNMSLGAFAPTVLSGYTTLVVGNLSNGGILKASDGVATARLSGGASGGVIVGAETSHDLLFMADGAEKWRMLTLGHLRPAADNSYSVGTGAYRVSVIYAGTATINTSDARLKQDVRDVSEAEKRVAEKCKALIKAFRFIDAAQEKGDNARTHFGVIAQDVEEAFSSEGLDAWKYGIMCSDPVKAVRQVERVIKVPKTELVTTKTAKVEVVDGVARWVETETQVEQPVTVEMPVIGKDGKPMTVQAVYGRRSEEDTGDYPYTHREPVMIDKIEYTTEEYDTGETRLGIRYEELLCFIISAL